jgi:hypothetical protein
MNRKMSLDNGFSKWIGEMNLDNENGLMWIMDMDSKKMDF